MASASSGREAAASGGSRTPRLLANTFWNIAGQLVPMAVGIAVLPMLIRTLGLDRYGFLTIVWVLVGYASVFDFGVGRVLVRVVAQRLARGDEAGAHHVARVGFGFLAVFGLAIGAIFAICSHWLVAHAFNLPPELEGEAHHAMWLLSASIPFVMLTTGYAAVLSAYQQFRGMNLVRGAMGILSYAGPLAVALWVNRLDALVAFTLMMRIVGTQGHAMLARRNCGFRYRVLWPDRATTREIFSLGGWISVSNIVAPLLSYLDRLLLGALVPVRMVAFYATPFDVVSKLTVLPFSLMTSLFPSAAAVQPGSDGARRMLLQTSRLLYVLILPLVFTAVALAHPALRLWLGEEFADRGAPVLQLLALGVFFNTLAQAPALLIQAAGQPRLMALLHLIELPLFIGVLYALTLRFGIVGTALAAVLRNGFDALAVLGLARRDVARGAISWRGAWGPALMAGLLLGAAAWARTANEALMVFAPGIVLLLLFSWRCMLHVHERDRLHALVRAR